MIYDIKDIPDDLREFFEPAPELGLEKTPEEYVSKMTEVFREVRRVLRQDGTLWLNLGDTFLNKQLLGIPWRVAIAMQADGWYLRSCNIWEKPTAMPESVNDRPSTSHEYVFLFAKSKRYFYDKIAVMEPSSGNAHPRGKGVNPKAKMAGANSRIFQDRDPAHPQARKSRQNESYSAAVRSLVGYRNLRTVWRIQSKPYKDAHFATFPPKLAETCLLAGTSEGGCCPTCGAPWKRIIKKAFVGDWHSDPELKKLGVNRNKNTAKFLTQKEGERGSNLLKNLKALRDAGGAHDNPFPIPETVGWEPACDYYAGYSHPCIAMDIFSGAGTTLLVALQLGLRFIGVELKPEYIEMSRERISAAFPDTEKAK